MGYFCFCNSFALLFIYLSFINPLVSMFTAIIFIVSYCNGNGKIMSTLDITAYK